MKHAGIDELAKIEKLLTHIRKYKELKEKSPGVFYFKSSAFLHFHEDAGSLYADLKVSGSWHRFELNKSNSYRNKSLVDTIDSLFTNVLND